MATACLLSLAVALGPHQTLTRRAAVATTAAAFAFRALPVRAEDGDGIVSFTLTEASPSAAGPQRGQRAVVDYTLWVGVDEAAWPAAVEGGKQIDSSKGSLFPPRPPSAFQFNVGVGEVIPGWDRTVGQMRVGEKRRVVIPSSLGYGDRGTGPIPGGAKLYFELELLDLKPMPTFSEKQLQWLVEHPAP